jgi:hypothetical protein
LDLDGEVVPPPRDVPRLLPPESKILSKVHPLPCIISMLLVLNFWYD